MSISLWDLLNCLNIGKSDNQRLYATIEDCMSDVYDGKVWNDFNSEKFSNFGCSHLNGIMVSLVVTQQTKHHRINYAKILM